MLTHKDLYTLIDEEFKKRLALPGSDSYENQTNRSQVLGSTSFSVSQTNIDLADVTVGLMKLLEGIVPPRIKSGLNVVATSPVSTGVTVKSGVGTVGGHIYRLKTDVTIKLPIPSDTDTSIFFVNLYEDGIQIDRTFTVNKLTLAKVIIPNPGTTQVIYDRDDEGEEWDGYIVQFQEYKLYGDLNGNLEEDSREFLRDNIGDILADNIIGNLRLNENLKITNTAGTLELNSDSLKLFDEDENLLSKFNDKGVYFYDIYERELARFTNIDARIGNILIETNAISSGNFVSGPLGKGFKIEDSGSAEFQNIFIRGKFSSSVFEHNSVSANGGNILISHDADKLAQDMTVSSTPLVTDGDTTFEVNDILWLKDKNNEEYMTITSVTDSSNYIVSRESGGTSVAWSSGIAIINLGQANDGGLIITASETYAPYLSVFTQDGSPWDGLNTKLRLGNLNGFLGYSSNKYGIAIGETDAYLKYDSANGLNVKGSIIVTGGNAAVTFYQASEPSGVGEKQGDYWIDTDDNNALYVYNSGSWTAITGGDAITTFRQSSIPIALNAGDLWINSDNDKLYRATNVGDDAITAGEWELQNAAIATGWSHASDTTKIDGGDIYTNTVTATQISVSQLDALTVNTGSLNIDEVIKSGQTAYNTGTGFWMEYNSGTPRFSIGDASTNSLTWNGTTLSVAGAIDANSGTIGALTIDGKLSIGSSGSIVSGQTAYDTGTGFWLEYNSGTPRFSIGNATGNKLLWNGTSLTTTGVINATSGNFSGTITVGSAGNVLIDGDNEVIKVFGSTITIIDDINDVLDWKENSSTYAATIDPDTYTGTELATELQTEMRALGDNDTTVTYSSSTRLLTIANSTITTLDLLFFTGTNTEQTIGQALGFSIGANKTGALTYTGTDEVTLRVKIGLL